MQKTNKGISKIFSLLLILGMLIISAIIFGYSNNINKAQTQVKVIQ